MRSLDHVEYVEPLAVEGTRMGSTTEVVVVAVNTELPATENPLHRRRNETALF